MNLRDLGPFFICIHSWKLFLNKKKNIRLNIKIKLYICTIILVQYKTNTV